MTLSPFQRRRMLLAAGVSAVAGGAVVLLQSGGGSGAYPHGSPLIVDLGDQPEGKLQTVEWRGLPVWVLRRSTTMVNALATRQDALTDADSLQSIQPLACRNQHRSVRPEIFVAVGLCTHQGCTPVLIADSFLCPCHASKYDLAGRVFKSGPALANLTIPAYRFESENRLLLGVES